MKKRFLDMSLEQAKRMKEYSEIFVYLKNIESFEYDENYICYKDGELLYNEKGNIVRINDRITYFIRDYDPRPPFSGKIMYELRRIIYDDYELVFESDNVHDVIKKEYELSELDEYKYGGGFFEIAVVYE